MIKRTHKDLFGTGGEDKIHIDEIADDLGRLLGDLTDWEAGENANGSYFKHASGLAVVFINKTIDYIEVGGTNIDGNARYSAPFTVTYPVEFVAPPAIIPAGNVSNVRSSHLGIYASNQNDRCSLHFLAGSSGSGNARYNVIAIGVLRE